jgi:hypothetical protein
MWSNTQEAIVIGALTLFALTFVLACSIPRIDAWEKAHGYPFGQMCNSIATGYVDTCPHRQVSR